MSLNFDEFQNIQQRLLRGGRLIFPDVFFQELTYMEQIVVLWKTKQNLLKAGDNITLHENEDGTVTISAGQGGEEESYRIEEVAPTSGNSKAYALINATTGEQSGSTIQIPTAIKGDKGDKGDTGNGIDSVTLAEELPTGNKYRIDMTDGTFYYFTAPKGAPGNPGEKGDAGFSPVAAVIPDSTGATITITDENGTSSVHINNGEQGASGITPDMNVNVSVGSNTGTPTATVTKSGTAAQPVFTVVFDGLKGEQGIPGSGADGVGISNISLKESTAAGNTYTITLSNGQTYDFTAPVGPQSTTPGPKGDKGDPGTDGFSPIATATRTGNTVVISITDANGTTSGTVYDGVSPTVAVTTITGGHQVEITTASGTERFDVMDGTNGNDGISPTVSVTPIIGGNQVTITSASGTEYFDVMDGTDGVGVSSVTYNSQDAQGGNVYDVNLTNGTVAGQITAPKGEQGQTGPGIPAINSGDAGKVLTVNSNETGAEWATPSGGGGGNSEAVMTLSYLYGATMYYFTGRNLDSAGISTFDQESYYTTMYGVKLVNGVPVSLVPYSEGRFRFTCPSTQSIQRIDFTTNNGGTNIYSDADVSNVNLFRPFRLGSGNGDLIAGGIAEFNIISESAQPQIRLFFTTPVSVTANTDYIISML